MQPNEVIMLLEDLLSKSTQEAMPVQFMGQAFWRQNLQKGHAFAPHCAIPCILCLPWKTQEPAFIKSRSTLTASPQTEFSWHTAKGTHLWKLVSFSRSPGGSFLRPGGSAPIAKDSFHLQLKGKICFHKHPQAARALQQKCHQAVMFDILLYKWIDSIRPPRLIVAKASTKTRRNHRPLRNAAAQKRKQCNFHENIAPWLRKGALATVVRGPAVGQRTFQRLFDYSCYHAILLFHDCGSLRVWVLIFCGVSSRFSKMIHAFRIQVQIYLLNMHCNSVLPPSAWSSRHSKAACFQISGNKGATLRSWNIKLKSAQVFRFRVKPSCVFASHCIFGKDFKHTEYIESLPWSVKPGAVAREKISVVAQTFMFLWLKPSWNERQSLSWPNETIATWCV